MRLCLKVLKAEIKNVSVTSVVISEHIKEKILMLQHTHHICREFDLLCSLHSLFSHRLIKMKFYSGPFFPMCILDLNIEKAFKIYFLII